MSEGKKPEDLASLHRRFDELEHVVARRVEETCAAVFRTPARTAGAVQPAWRRRTRGERRWQVAACTAVAIGLQVAVPGRLAFSPTDVMPLSRRAKLAMALQSVISIVTVALVVARAVNILK